MVTHYASHSRNNRAQTAFKSCNTKSSRAKYIQVVYITDISRAAQDRVVLKSQDNNQVAHLKNQVVDINQVVWEV